jgi:hypothetical protein
MPWVRFEPTIPVSERAKTVHALERSAAVTGACKVYLCVYYDSQSKNKYFVKQHLPYGLCKVDGVFSRWIDSYVI